MVDIKIEIKNLEQFKKAFSKAPDYTTKNLSEAIRQTIFFVENKAVTNAPVKTGYLGGSVYRSFAPLRGEIGFKAKYAAWVHDGTTPYVIYPSSKKALYW